MQDRTPTRRTISLVVLAAALILLLLVAPDVLLVIFAGILFAVFFGGGGGWIARKTGMSRPLGIGLFILLILIALGGAMLGFAPAMAEQFDQLTEEIPAAFESLRERVEQYSWGERLTGAIDPSSLMSSESGLAAASAVTGTFGALGNFVIMLFIGIYGALNPGLYRKGLLALLALVTLLLKTLLEWRYADLLAATHRP